VNSEKKRAAASVKQKLLNRARKEHRLFDELLQYYAIEKFLLRMSRSVYVDRFVLKGALLLRTTNISDMRPTRDIDFLSPKSASPEELEKLIAECCQVTVQEDGLVFDPGSIRSEEIREQHAYQGIRLKLRGSLGTAVITVQMDIGFGDVVTPVPLWVEFPSLLGDEKPKIKAYTLESAIAEKYQAMIQLDLANSRMKDFYDIYFLCRNYSFEGPRLQKAIQQTFERRNTDIPEDVPSAFTKSFHSDPSTQAQWRAFRKKLSAHELPEDLEVVLDLIQQFLWPVTEQLNRGATMSKNWRPDVGWHEPIP